MPRQAHAQPHEPNEHRVEHLSMSDFGARCPIFPNFLLKDAAAVTAALNRTT